jgi:hypothetical protein
VAICAAAAAGVDVLSDSDDRSALTNIAKVSSSKHLSPAVFRRDGAIRYDDLDRTALVILSLDEIGEGTSYRPTLHSGRDEGVFHMRATRWWPLKSADTRRHRKRAPDGSLPRDVERLIAVQKGVGTILGAWRLADEQWRQDDEGWVFLTNGAITDLRGQQFEWCGVYQGTKLTWSSDIRAEIRGWSDRARSLRRSN